MNKTFIFDLDDTLTFNQHYYSLAQMEFARYIFETLGPKAPNAQVILNLEVKNDLESVQKMGFAKERFPTSFAETYRQISEKMDESPKQREKHILEAYTIGAKVFDSNAWLPDLVPGALYTLEFLVQQKDDLFLLTTGDEEIQRKKVEKYSLSNWFGDNINIVPHHKKERIAEIATGKDKRNVWFVGNSAKSDIAPSLEVGIGAIYIPQETWAYECHDLDKADKTHLVTLKEIGEIPRKYSSL
ncbi:MAG: HAD family hydrolase [archaeon]